MLRTHLISKMYMTRVESENMRLRHYLTQLHRSYIVLFQIKSVEMLECSLRLLLHYLKHGAVYLAV